MEDVHEEVKSMKNDKLIVFLTEAIFDEYAYSIMANSVHFVKSTHHGAFIVSF